MRTAPELGSNLAGQLRISALRLLRRLRAEHTPDTLSSVQFSALSCLYRHGAMTPRELAIYEGVQPPTVTRLIASLQSAKLISRQVHPDDRRQLLLQLTPSGTELLAATDAESQQWLAAHLVELTDDDRATLAAAVPIINKIVND
jgi:DNA-binding MarR family transcriptional regulator